ncbi:NAD-dependent epimerase/dehydratase family protein [Brucellaceae bacterium VT-16-1752]|nr:NAD-dependent epimerase/dehydratase family protein [Brucellaceae bacterium VT-16-1752]
MFFVSGITGKVGSAAARRLLENGCKLRTLVRDPVKAAEWAQKGVDVRQGDLTDADALAAALEGVQAAFLMQPTPFGVLPDFPEAKAINAGLAEALRRVSIPRLVVLSSVGSEQPGGLGNITQTHLLEEALRNVNMPIAFIRAGSFLENYIADLQAAASSGVFYSFLQPTDRTVPMVASKDIGNEVARLLTSDWTGRKIVELGSQISPDDLARAMSKVLDRPVVAQPIPRERWTATLEEFGLSTAMTGPWEEMQDAFNSGWIGFGVPGTEPVAGTTAPAEVFTQARKV